MKYNPDNWIIVKIAFPDKEVLYKILAGWSGGYLDGDAWRMNSGIDKVEVDGDIINFIGTSGSVYSCHKNSETVRMNNAFIWERLQKEYPDYVSQIDYVDFVKEFV